MAEYINKTDLLERLQNVLQSEYPENKIKALYAHSVVSHAPAADVVEVVRCRDCQYGRVVRCGDTEVIDCAFEDDEYLHERLPTDFCSYGERRTECTTKDITE